ncbi:MAG: DUF6268 family outer membrane beta-barrel protein [Gemmatimonadaceae bacterium]|nr:DUF6268 family outer membrane beta-barrel protein [Gemmatimonadaceae bacterium]
MTGRSVVSLRAAVAGLLVLGATRLSAQREQLSLRIEQFGGARAPVDFAQPPRDLDMRLWQLTATAGVRNMLDADGNTVLTNGVFYRRSVLDARLLGRSIGTETLHALYYDFLALRTLDDRHTLAVAVRPGLFGNLERDLGDQFRAEGAAFIDRVVSPRTTLGLGMSYTSNLGRVLPIPVLHIVHRRGRSMLIDGLLPSRLDVWWFPRKGLEVGLNAQLSGFQYHVADAPAPSPVPGTLTFVAPTRQLANAVVGPQVRWNATGKWYLSLDAGVTVLRRLSYEDGTENALTPRNTGLVRLGLQRMY